MKSWLVEKSIVYINLSDRMNIMNDIRKKFNNVLKANVFYNMSLIKLKHIANNYKEDSEDLNHYINNLEIDNLSKYMLLEVVTLAEGRFEYVIPSQKLSESILFFVVLFLTKPREDVTNEKKLLLNPLIMNNRCNENGGVIDSARLSFLILHLLYFILNITLHFLIIIVFLQNFENLDRDEIEMLLIHKEDVRTLKAGNLKDYLAEKLTSMNSKLNGPDAILDICLPYVLHPIKSLVITNSEERYYSINNEELEQIVNRILFLFDPVNFLEVMLSLKIKDY